MRGGSIALRILPKALGLWDWTRRRPCPLKWKHDSLAAEERLDPGAAEFAQGVAERVFVGHDMAGIDGEFAVDLVLDDVAVGGDQKGACA